MASIRDPRKYRVIRKGKRDYRSMVLDIVAFERKIFHLARDFGDNIHYADLKYLLALERLSIYKKKSISVMDISVWLHLDRKCVYASLRRMIPKGLVVEVSKGRFEVTMYANTFIERFITQFNRFLSGKITDPFD